jgi:hypothetical protein
MPPTAETQMMELEMLQPSAVELTILAISVALRLLSWSLHTAVEIKKGRVRWTAAAERVALMLNLSITQVSLHFVQSSALNWWFAFSVVGIACCLYQQAPEQEQENGAALFVADKRKRWRALMQPLIWCAGCTWFMLHASSVQVAAAATRTIAAQFARHCTLQLLAAVYCS